MGTATEPTDLGLISAYVVQTGNVIRSSASTISQLGTEPSDPNPASTQYFEFEYTGGLHSVEVKLTVPGEAQGDEEIYAAMVPGSGLVGNSDYDMGSASGIYANALPPGTHNIYDDDTVVWQVNPENPGTAEFAVSGFDIVGETHQTENYIISVQVDSESPIACFASGTLIRTTRGDITVEDLKADDVALTASGKARPIAWIGHRSVECARHPSPAEVMPVRIAAHAFGPNRPARDLVVSPGHAICLNVMGEVLVPAGSLVDGNTIFQEHVERVTYWHVEFDSHDILLAENLSCESYLEMGNRGFFREAAVVDLAAGPDVVGKSRLTHAAFCRPVHADGPVVAAARARVQALAGTWRTPAVSAATAAV